MRNIVYLCPLLLAAFPVIFLASQNPFEVTVPQILGVLLVVVSGTLLLTIGLRVMIRSNAKASALASVLVIAFFSYGHLVDGAWAIASHLPLVEAVGWRFFQIAVTFLGGVGLAASFWAILRYKGKLDAPMRYFGAAILVLLLLNATTFTLSVIQADDGLRAKSNQVTVGVDQTINTSLSGSKRDLPDIYYIILDGYTRGDVLDAVHGFDNSEFLGALQEKGFYVAEQSRSNYIHTQYSVPSSLNMRYLDNDETTLGQMSQIFVNNEAMRLAKAMGYKIVHFDSTWRFTADNPNADLEIRPPRSFWREALLNDFSESLLNSTTARLFDNQTRRLFSSDYLDVFHYTVDKLGSDIPKVPGPTFTFVHFAPPHPPFIFDRNGRVLSKTKDNPQTKYDWHLKDLYVDELIYLNSVVIGIVNQILLQSDTEPVIILQGDHGTASSMDRSLGSIDANLNDLFIFERTGILNAYYLPEYCRYGLYPTISPVNSFRVVYNSCLGTNLRLLEDKSYFRESAPIKRYFEVVDEFTD